MSSFVGLYTGLSGIRAAQTGIDVTSNNVANANTPGYTRQRVELAASHSYQSPVGLLGTGVSVEQIARLRDPFLDNRYRGAVADHAAASTRAELLASMEALTGEPDDGLSGRIARLWPAAEAWANDPNDPASRGQVITELHSIADGFRATNAAWQQLAADSGDRRDTVIDTVNATLQTLDDLNRRLANADPSRVGPDLLDQRDLLLDQLAALTGAKVTTRPDGSVSATLGGTELLTEHGPATLRAADGVDLNGEPMAGAIIQVSQPTADPGEAVETDVTAALTGELGGLQQALTSDLPRWTQELDQLAALLVDALNAVNAQGLTADGQAGGPLLAGDSAGTIRVADGVTGASLAAGQGTVGTAPQPHDGRNARSFAELRTARLPDEGGKTLENGLADLIVGLAGQVRSSRATADAARGVASGARLARAAEHGVSMDEEMVRLVQFQRALEAAARVMTTVDQALDVLVNRTGIVGR